MKQFFFGNHSESRSIRRSFPFLCPSAFLYTAVFFISFILISVTLCKTTDIQAATIKDSSSDMIFTSLSDSECSTLFGSMKTLPKRPAQTKAKRSTNAYLIAKLYSVLKDMKPDIKSYAAVPDDYDFSGCTTTAQKTAVKWAIRCRLIDAGSFNADGYLKRSAAYKIVRKAVRTFMPELETIKLRNSNPDVSDASSVSSSDFSSVSEPVPVSSPIPSAVSDSVPVSSPIPSAVSDSVPVSSPIPSAVSDSVPVSSVASATNSMTAGEVLSGLGIANTESMKAGYLSKTDATRMAANLKLLKKSFYTKVDTPMPTATATPMPTATATPMPTATATPVPTKGASKSKYIKKGKIYMETEGDPIARSFFKEEKWTRGSEKDNLFHELAVPENIPYVGDWDVMYYGYSGTAGPLKMFDLGTYILDSDITITEFSSFIPTLLTRAFGVDKSGYFYDFESEEARKEWQKDGLIVAPVYMTEEDRDNMATPIEGTHYIFYGNFKGEGLFAKYKVKYK